MPPHLLVEGAPVREWYRVIAQHGEFGSGDAVDSDNIEAEIEARMVSVRRAEPTNYDRPFGDGRIAEVRRSRVEGGGFVTTYADITERKKAEQALQTQTEIVELLHKTAVIANQAQTVNDALKSSVDAICTYNSWPVGHVYQCRPNAPDTLVSTDIWHLDQPERFATFRRITEGTTFNRGIGLPGRVLESGNPAWIVDVTKDPNFPRARLAEDIGVKTGFAVPVLVGDEVVAVMEFFAAEAIEPNHDLLSVLDNIGTQVGRVVERKRAEDLITEAHRLIIESVNYAANIQRSLLPAPSSLEERFADHFVWWEPRDSVGGDFYWLRPCEGGHLLIVCDCTGHGVPGAFMTLIGTGALDQALVDHPDGDPAKVLGYMNQFVKRTLMQDSDEGVADDGMELGICRINRDGSRLIYSGARFALLLIDGDTPREIKGDKTGIGYRRVDPNYSFTNYGVEVSPDISYYLYSDGIVDQIGGEKRRSFGRKRLLRLLADLQKQPLSQQMTSIQEEFNHYQGGEIRRDDVTIIGFRL